MTRIPLLPLALILLIAFPAFVDAAGPFSTIDLNQGDVVEVKLTDGSTTRVELLAVHESRGEVWNEINRAAVDLKVNGETITIVSGVFNNHIFRKLVQAGSSFHRSISLIIRQNPETSRSLGVCSNEWIVSNARRGTIQMRHLRSDLECRSLVNW